jgi:hypothetical protein
LKNTIILNNIKPEEGLVSDSEPTSQALSVEVSSPSEIATRFRVSYKVQADQFRNGFRKYLTDSE